MSTRFLLEVGWMFLSLPVASFAQGTFQNGTFDLPGLTSFPAARLGSPGDGFITGWTTAPGYNGTYSGSVDYFHDRSQDPGGYCVELGYYFGINGLQQTFNTMPNQMYLVSFWLATDAYNGPSAILRVSAGLSSTDYQAPAGSGNQLAMGWQPHAFTFTSDNTGSTTLWFGNLVGIPAIDTVSVTLAPEPSACGLLGLGAAIIVLAAKFHRMERPNHPAPANLAATLCSHAQSEWREVAGRDR